MAEVETEQVGSASSPIPDLPGSGSPPLEGAVWLKVKIGVWAVLLVLAAMVAFGVASLLS